MSLSLDSNQLSAIDKLETGSILCGGVGSGKSRTALAYYYMKECKGTLRINGQGITTPRRFDIPLYVITTAHVRDLKQWECEASPFGLYDIHVDSWNNIGKYTEVRDAFFIFDEQRVVGSGSWAKSFIRISKANHWILLSGTPGDTWMDYVSVFIANGFYRNRTQFLREHVIFSRFSKYPKVERYVNEDVLEAIRKEILVKMPDTRGTIQHHINVNVPYDKIVTRRVLKDRWNVFDKEPIRDAGQLCLILRRIANADNHRLAKVIELVKRSKKCIVFYNYNYELDMLKEALDAEGILYREWNGHNHDDLPVGVEWVYLVQYTAGAEGWNCTTTDTVIFYSNNYSYKIMEQAAGRIDRRDTPYRDLYYYHLISDSPIDISILNALDRKKVFNERAFYDRARNSATCW